MNDCTAPQHPECEWHPRPSVPSSFWKIQNQRGDVLFQAVMVSKLDWDIVGFGPGEYTILRDGLVTTKVKVTTGGHISVENV